MPSLFISYASKQQGLAQQLEAALSVKGVQVWRDKTHLHAGDRWPKKLGDAIAESDALVLLWSSEANQSDFVELEWNIAVAMKKPIIPCLIEDTTLPPTLTPSHRILGRDLAKVTNQILTALQELPASSASERQHKLLNSLTTVQAAEPKQILDQIKTIINQPNWSIGGNVYQAQGDIHIIGEQSNAKKQGTNQLDAWIKWVGLGVASLILVSLLLDLPTKTLNVFKNNDPSVIPSLQPSESGRSPGEGPSEEAKPNPSKKAQETSASSPQKLSGIVTDQVTGDPVKGATVSIPSLNKQVTTNAQGFFTLDLIHQNNEKVLVVVQKDPYETYRTKATPGNTNLGFVLRKKS